MKLKHIYCFVEKISPLWENFSLFSSVEKLEFNLPMAILRGCIENLSLFSSVEN